MSFGGAFCNKGLPLLLPLPVLADLTLTGIETVTDGTMAQVRTQAPRDEINLIRRRAGLWPNSMLLLVCLFTRANAIPRMLSRLHHHAPTTICTALHCPMPIVAHSRMVSKVVTRRWPLLRCRIANLHMHKLLHAFMLAHPCMVQVAQQSGLTRLGLSGGFHLGRRGLLSLVALTSLRHLSISRCPGISHADVDQLRTAHSAAIHGGPMTACMQQPDAEPDVWSQHLPGSAAAPGNPGDSSRTAEGGLGVPRVESLSAMQRIASLNAMPRVDSMTSLPCMESLAIAGDASRQRMWAAGAGGCMMQVTLTPAMDHQATA